MSDAALSDPAAIVAELEARGRRVETPCGDGTIVWHVWGEGEPLVLGHGAQGGWTHWIRNIDDYAKTRMVIAVDLPGHGDSAMPPTQDHRGMVDVLAAGLKVLVGDQLPVDLVGFSFSGTIFAHLAAYHPEVARRLILVGCGGLDTPHGPIRLGKVGGLEGEERQQAIRNNILGLMLHADESVDDMAMYLQMWNGKRNVFRSAHDLVVPDKLVKILPQVQCPVDGIWGEFDRPHPPQNDQEKVLRSIQPGVDFRVIEGGGHWIMYERTQAFNETLLDMLAKPLRAVL